MPAHSGEVLAATAAVAAILAIGAIWSPRTPPAEFAEFSEFAEFNQFETANEPGTPAPAPSSPFAGGPVAIHVYGQTHMQAPPELLWETTWHPGTGRPPSADWAQTHPATVNGVTVHAWGVDANGTPRQRHTQRPIRPDAVAAQLRRWTGP